MFFHKSLKPTKLKRVVYLISTTVLGVLLSVIAHVLIEINYLQWAVSQGRFIRFYNGCALPPSLQLALLLVGVAGGFALGKFWWQKLYIERVWRKKSKML